MTTTFTAPAGTAASGRERCSSCDATLAADQRYCVECGQRRGAARFSAQPAAQPAPEPRKPRLARATSGTTLVGGVATLLLALGVGVLIGRSGEHGTTTAKTPVQVVTFSGGAQPAAGATAAVTATPTARAGAKVAAAKAAKSAASKPVSSTTNEIAKSVPKAVVKIGTPGKGPGYENGKFTGNFFGN